MNRKRKPPLFRKVAQALGVTLVLWGLYRAAICGWQMVQGEVSIAGGALTIFLLISILCGVGLLLVLFDPHKLIQTDSYKLDRLNRQRPRQSFAEKIHADDE